MSSSSSHEQAQSVDVPHRAYDALVARFADAISIEDIWIEERDEGTVCVVEVYFDPEAASEALADLAERCSREGATLRFIVREPRVTRTSYAYLRHSDGAERKVLRGPFHRETDGTGLLLLSTTKESFAPEDGWNATIRTLWDEITLSDVTLIASGNCTGAKSRSISVRHLRSP